MSTPSLLVPITLDGLLVGSPDRTGSAWAMTATNYQNLLIGMVPDTAPPFTTKTAALPAIGAHLLWTLPYSLRQGRQTASGTVEFPKVPNRWLVLRIFTPDGGGGPGLTAWVLQSDLLSPLTDVTQPQFPDPADHTAKMIGGRVVLADWREPGTAGPALQAVGPGDTAWAAAYDNVRHVFAFHDALDSRTGTATYSVAGWYSDPAADPLSALPAGDPAAWQSQLQQGLSWTIGDGQAAIDAALDAWAGWLRAHGQEPPAKPPLPNRMVAHGMLAAVDWRGPDQSYGTGAPGGGRIYPAVAVGNSPVEAISAWLAKVLVEQTHGSPDTIPRIERAIAAFQQGILVELQDDPVAAETKLHGNAFDSTDGGLEWVVVRPQADGAVPPFGGQQTVPLSQPLTDQLTALNTAQAALDQRRGAFDGLASELFAVNFKYQNAPRDIPADILARITAARSALIAATREAGGAVTQQQRVVDGLADALRQALGADYVLQTSSLPSYRAPNDPVIMVAGAKADTKFAAPGTYGGGDLLPCRVTGQTISGLTVDTAPAGGSGAVTLGGADLLGRLTLPQGRDVPQEAPDLWLELLFLDTAQAPLLADLAFGRQGVAPTVAQRKALADTIAALQTSVWNDPDSLGISRQALAGAAGLIGVPPDKTAVEYRQGQPWTPLYLDWKVRWHPSAMTPADQLAAWSLGEIDLEWTAGKVPPALPMTFYGRTLLNDRVAQGLGDKLASFADDPDFADVDAFIRQALGQLGALMARFDVMTQSLGGLTQQFINRMIAPNDDVQSPEVAALISGLPVGLRPMPGNGFTVAPPFFPIRAGHFEVIDLWVVDAFGQVLRGKDPTLGADAPIPDLIRADAMVTAGSNNAALVQLPPRLAQPARGRVRLLDAGKDALPSNSSDLTSPICGWVMPNHLDASLLVFAADGTLLGSVIRFQTETAGGDPTGTALRWDAPPGSDLPLGAPPDLPNAHLQGFVGGLLARAQTMGGEALDELLDYIDSSLWVTALPSRQTGNLTVLFGPPLAVVRAEARLSLCNPPVYGQSWADTGKYYLSAGGGYQPQPVPFQSVPLPARLGDLGQSDNGVMAYAVDDDYATLYAVYGANRQTAAIRRTLQTTGKARDGMLLGRLARPESGVPTGEGGYVETGHLLQLPADGSRTLLTMLVDPRGVIPLVTGWQPVDSVALPNGPVTRALSAMRVAFRTGPLLVDPARIRVPLPAEIRGDWAWAARRDVTAWQPEQALAAADPVAQLAATPPRLAEGWFTLSGAFGKDE